MCFRCKLVTIGHLWVIEEIYFGEICQHLPGQPPCVDIKPGIDPTFQINMLATGALSSSVYLDIFTIYTSCILSGKHLLFSDKSINEIKQNSLMAS